MEQQETVLLGLLRQAITGKPKESLTADADVFACAMRHKVLPLLYDVLDQQLTEEEQRILDRETQKTIAQFWRLFHFTKRACAVLENAGVTVAVLKGISAANAYPLMEYRKSGDVDLLVRTEEMDRAEHALEAIGCKRASLQDSLHHVAFESLDGIEIEVHTLFAEPFDNKEANQKLEQFSRDALNHIVQTEIEGTVFPMLEPAWLAFSLVMHMLQHYLRAGFGLKLLTDWTVFWNENGSEELKAEYTAMVSELKIDGFSDLVSSACVEFLGLSESCMPGNRTERNLCEAFLNEVFAGGEFGHDQSSRMVALRKNSLLEYVREFHHQMRLNYPDLSSYIPLWPGLWAATLIRFLNNNRKLRKISAVAILKEAGRRGKLNEQIHLFEPHK